MRAISTLSLFSTHVSMALFGCTPLQFHCRSLSFRGCWRPPPAARRAVWGLQVKADVLPIIGWWVLLGGRIRGHQMECSWCPLGGRRGGRFDRQLGGR